MILIIIGILVTAQVMALLWLASTVSSYQKFWKQQAGEPGELTYLALGDSAAQGIGASKPSRGYVGLIASRLEKQTGKTVRVINLSKSGATMDDYLKEQALQITNIDADVVTIEIGANDVSSFNADKFRADFKKVLQTLPQGTFVANMPLFNSRPWVTNKSKQASQIVDEELKAYPKLHPVNLHKQTTDHQSVFGFAPDLFHPNDISYKNWADAFWQEIQNHQVGND